MYNLCSVQIPVLVWYCIVIVVMVLLVKVTKSSLPVRYFTGLYYFVPYVRVILENIAPEQENKIEISPLLSRWKHGSFFNHHHGKLILEEKIGTIVRMYVCTKFKVTDD